MFYTTKSVSIFFSLIIIELLSYTSQYIRATPTDKRRRVNLYSGVDRNNNIVVATRYLALCDMIDDVYLRVVRAEVSEQPRPNGWEMCRKRPDDDHHDDDCLRVARDTNTLAVRNNEATFEISSASAGYNTIIII